MPCNMSYFCDSQPNDMMLSYIHCSDKRMYEQPKMSISFLRLNSENVLRKVSSTKELRHAYEIMHVLLVGNPAKKSSLSMMLYQPCPYIRSQMFSWVLQCMVFARERKTSRRTLPIYVQAASSSFDLPIVPRLILVRFRKSYRVDHTGRVWVCWW